MLNVDTSVFKIKVRDHVATVHHKESGETWSGPYRDLPHESFLVHASEEQVNAELEQLFDTDRPAA